MPRRCRLAIVTSLAVLALGGPATARAQTPAPKPPPPIKKWTAGVSAGLTVTRGNRDTATFNAGFDVKYDPKTRELLKADGVFIRGTTSGEVSTSRLLINLRDEYQANGRVFVFAQAQYLRDRFKGIEYLVAPTAGLGFRIEDKTAIKISLNAGVGGVWEQNPGRAIRRSSAVTLGERVSYAISPTVTLTQALSGLWKPENFRDALFSFSAGLIASMNSKTQIKIEWIDAYKTRPPSPGILKNDLTLIVALVVRN